MDTLIKFVIPKVMAEWEKIAYALHYTIFIVNSLKEKHKSDPSKCCMELFNDWLITNNGDGPKLWSTLLYTLKGINELTAATEAIIEDLKKNF